jgi:glycine betaine/proline transport system substrate-binding protein
MQQRVGLDAWEETDCVPWLGAASDECAEPIDYLGGGDDVFDPNDGVAKVFTTTPPDYAARCPNAANLVSNPQFTTAIENRVMVPIMDKEEPNKAALEWLKANPQTLDKWLAGVRKINGTDGLAAARAYLASY